MSDECQECGHNKHVHVNWVGSCAVYNRGKRCPCGVYRDTKLSFTGPTYSVSQEVLLNSQPDPVQQKDVADLWYPEVANSQPYCSRCGRSALAAVIDPKNGICTYCITDRASKKDGDDPDYWLRYRKADLVAQIAAEEALGRNTGLLHAAKRMVAHLEGRTDMKPKRNYAKPEPITIKKYDSIPAGEPLVADPISIIMCDQCPSPHPKAFCPKRKAADQDSESGKEQDTSEKEPKTLDVFWESLQLLRADVDSLTARMNLRKDDHDLMRDFVHRANIESNKRLDMVSSDIGRLDNSYVAQHRRVNAMDDGLNLLRETVGKLVEKIEKLEKLVSLMGAVNLITPENATPRVGPVWGVVIGGEPEDLYIRDNEIVISGAFTLSRKEADRLAKVLFRAVEHLEDEDDNE